MAFLMYEYQQKDEKNILRNINEHFSLAGYNLIYKAWENRGKPIEKGWHVSADELISIHTNEKHNYNSRRLIIDFDPRAKKRIGLVELLDVYAFTHGAENPTKVDWIPLMLKLRDIYYEEFETPLLGDYKQNKISQFEVRDEYEEIIEFLYLNGDFLGWNWRTNGRTAAAFLYKSARDYFRQYF